MSGRCLKAAWRVSGRCLKGVWSVSGRCLKGVWGGVSKVSGGYLLDVLMVCEVSRCI